MSGINKAFFETVLRDFREKNAKEYLCDASDVFKKKWHIRGRYIIVRFAKYYLSVSKIENFRVLDFSDVLFNVVIALPKSLNRGVRIRFLEFTIRLLKEPLLFGMYHLDALQKIKNCLREGYQFSHV